MSLCNEKKYHFNVIEIICTLIEKKLQRVSVFNCQINESMEPFNLGLSINAIDKSCGTPSSSNITTVFTPGDGIRYVAGI